MGDDRRNSHRENAVLRGAPKRAVTVVRHPYHIIGTQSVGFCHGIELLAVVVEDTQSFSFLDHSLHAIV